MTLTNNISVIFKESLNGVVYALCQIEIFGYVKYALAIIGDTDADIEFIDTERETAEKFFLKATEYGLSPIHLKDAINDYLLD